jgi:hypothetical protein
MRKRALAVFGCNVLVWALMYLVLRVFFGPTVALTDFRVAAVLGLFIGISQWVTETLALPSRRWPN